MRGLLQREPGVELPLAVRGEGIYLFDKRGNRYLDAAAGGGVSCLGHNDPEVIAAMKAQLDRLAYANNSIFSNIPAETAAQLLGEHAPAGLDQVYFVSGGAEAVEAALKIARQYFVELGERERRFVIGRQHSFHGNTLATVALGGNASRHALFEPLLPERRHISACYAYRDQAASETAEQYGKRVADELESLVHQLGPRAIAAMVVETVVGATLGAVPAVPGYFRRLREICSRYGILLIMDEVMCGMGRTGSLFAFEQEDVTPDIVCVSKALGAGYQPIAATIVSRKIRHAIATGSGTIQHFHTYQAHPIACVAAQVVLAKVVRPEMLAQVRARGDRLLQRLRERLSGHPYVGDIRGRGLFIGVEFVRDRTTRERFEPARRVNVAVKREAMRLGLTVTGPIAAVNDCAMLSPPYIVTESEIDLIADLFSEAIEAALAKTATAA
jgi:adenosylmethionine-8-amino-7-oxononanoate aminotransferase